MNRLDADKDGPLSRDAFPDPDKFSEIDKDVDGHITERELTAGRPQGDRLPSNPPGKVD